MTKVDPYDNYLVSKRKSEAEEWEVYNIAPMTLHESLTAESYLSQLVTRLRFNSTVSSTVRKKLSYTKSVTTNIFQEAITN